MAPKGDGACHKQHWAIPKSGNCVLCAAPLPIPEKKQNQLPEKTFMSHGVKKLFDKLDGKDGPDADMDEDERMAKLTKSQALYDSAVQMGFANEAVLKPMRDQIDLYKNPKTKNLRKIVRTRYWPRQKGLDPRSSDTGMATKRKWTQKYSTCKRRSTKPTSFWLKKKRMLENIWPTTRKPKESTTGI